MTKIAPFSNWLPLVHRNSLLAAVLGTVAGLCPLPARAGIPDWMRAATLQPLSTYPDDTAAVIVFDEQVTTVKDKGEIDTTYRRVYKILRPEGDRFGRLTVYFDSETSLASLKGWALTDDSKEYEVKEKDAIETTPFLGMLFRDTRLKTLRIPAANPGSFIGYEYQQRRRPFVLQDTWYFQEDIPVRHTRFVLRIPSNWDVKPRWQNSSAVDPHGSGSDKWVWELENISAVEEEQDMPAWQAVAGRLSVSYTAPDRGRQAASFDSWDDVGRWVSDLSSDRRRSSPEIRQKALELTARASTWLDKVRALATFVQNDVRYVAIEVGIGGYQPHPAADVFANRYGDCKDKATLLSVMLAEIGVKSYYVLIHTDRGVVSPDIPTLAFNHVILAIALPPDFDMGSSSVVMRDARVGPLLLFDPTSTHNPIGSLPAPEQDSSALLVTDGGGTIVRTPLAPAGENKLLRIARLSLGPDGALSGEVTEMRRGAVAAELRSSILSAREGDRSKVLEKIIAYSLSDFAIQNPTADGLDAKDDVLTLRYSLRAEGYAQQAGDLMLLRPRVLGVKGEDLLQDKPRKYSVDLRYPSLQGDSYEITLPPGYIVDELPAPVTAQSPGWSYSSSAEVKNGILTYKRVFERKTELVPLSGFDEMKAFYRRVATDERALAVLKQSAPPAK